MVTSARKRSRIFWMTIRALRGEEKKSVYCWSWSVDQRGKGAGKEKKKVTRILPPFRPNLVEARPTPSRKGGGKKGEKKKGKNDNQSAIDVPIKGIYLPPFFRKKKGGKGKGPSLFVQYLPCPRYVFDNLGAGNAEGRGKKGGGEEKA